MLTPVHTVPKKGSPSTETADALPFQGTLPCIERDAPDWSTALCQMKGKRNPRSTYTPVSENAAP